MCLKNVGNVPGSGPCTKGFNNGTLPPVRIFKGPYACEEDAELDVHTDTSLSACSRACLARSNCNFYMFRATDETCTLYEACDYMQQVNLKISNELYGIPPRNVSYCRIADPGTCWQDIKRRSYLSLIESDLPKCLFQEQHVACDSLQLVSGLSTSGNSLWGLSCPEGAVVVSAQRSLPHCLQINASAEPWIASSSGSDLHIDLQLTSYSGSISCPAGMALGGWYNLPGVPVRRSGQNGGPHEFTGLLVTCRQTSLLVSCAPPEKPACQSGQVVNSISFNENEFKVGCCRLQSLLGAKFVPQSRKQVPYNDFEGYYCPVVKDNTGAMVYSKTSIKQLGEPGNVKTSANWTLSWNRFDVRWDLRKDDQLYSSAAGDAVYPAELQFSSNFSATSIRPLKATWLRRPKVESPFPKKKPTYPKLKTFVPEKPDYKEYCSPEFLQKPSSFKGSISEDNPCHHTFNQDMVQGLDRKGITENYFWSCADRSKARQYMRDVAVAAIQEQNAKMDQLKRTEQEVMSAVQMAAAVVGMIPWGSFGPADKAGAKKTEQEEELTHTPTAGEVNAGLGDIATKTYNFAFTFGSALTREVQAGEEIHNNEAEEKEAPETSTSEDSEKLKELEKELVPAFGEGEDPLEQNSEFHKELAKAEWADCMPLQAGLSKVMCDLFCVQDSVRAGTTAVLQSLGDSQKVLLDNLQALLNYQTQYILWAFTQLPAANASLMQEAIPSVSDILAELTQAKNLF
eukprot:Skav234736  [mRNA]  locus=scaffold14:49172:60213:+ [translate_table: standard]